MSSVINFFKGIADFFSSVVDFVISLFEDLVWVTKTITSLVPKVTEVFGAFLPASIVAILGTILAVVIIYKLLGREG